MKKFLIVGLLSVFLLVGCGYQEGSKIMSDHFVVIEKQSDDVKYYTYKVYDKETKVIYLIFDGSYSGGITPLYNADGTLQIYEGK